MKYLLLSIICLFSVRSGVSAQSRPDTSARMQPDYKLIVAASVGAVYGVSAHDFFEEYGNPFTFGGQASTFNIPFSYGASIKADLGQGMRYGLNGEFFKAVMRDGYQQPVLAIINDEIDTVGTRNVGGELSVQSIPILATIDFIPVEAQFTTYFGVGAGISLNKIKWTENISSTIPNDPRKTGTRVDESRITPAGRVYAGVELDFDKRRTSKSILGSLLLEVRYTYIPVSAKLLESFSGFPLAPERWKEDFRVGGSGLGLNLCVSFEFPGYFRK